MWNAEKSLFTFTIKLLLRLMVFNCKIANNSTSLSPSSFLNFLPLAGLTLFLIPLFFQEGTLEAAVQPEDHSGGPCVHQQPKCVVTLWWAAASAQRHEQHLKQWPEEWTGEDLTDRILYYYYYYYFYWIAFSHCKVTNILCRLMKHGELLHREFYKNVILEFLALLF